MVQVRVTVDDDDIDDELSRLIAPPLMALEGVLTAQFAATQAQVHVDTGSLRGSGEIDSAYARGVWEGQITYGGPSPGFPNDPVDYAYYEFRRGGAHDFREPAEALDARYGQAMRRHLRGRP